jgi:uncharacterized membrane protein YphA (DoxX/SURF4 family)
MRSTFLWIARIFFSLLFIFGGVGKLINWQGAVNGLTLTFSEWHMHLEGALIKENIHEMLLSRANVIMGVVIGFELIGAVLLLFGFKIKVGAVLLLLFLIPTTIVMHPFWFKVGSELKQELSIFLKNLSLIGALLYIALTPSQKRSAVR